MTVFHWKIHKILLKFGNKLSFKQPITQNQPELVYYSGVQKGDIVETIATNLVSNAENERMSDAPGDSLEVQDTASYQIYHASKLLRSLLLEMKPSMPWPPSPQDLDDGSSIVPNLLYNMFIIIIIIIIIIIVYWNPSHGLKG